jgi:hypothetical protein
MSAAQAPYGMAYSAAQPAMMDSPYPQTAISPYPSSRAVSAYPALYPTPPPAAPVQPAMPTIKQESFDMQLLILTLVSEVIKQTSANQ